MISSLSAWALSIAGVVLLGVVVDMVLPSGQTAKYIKSILAFVVVLVVVSPVPKLLNRDITISDFFEQSEIQLQDDFIYQLNRDKLTAQEDLIEKDIENEGISGVQVIVSANIFTTNMEINAIFVDLSLAVIPENMEHMNTIDIIKKCIVGRTGVSEEVIVFNE